ncbi:MAG: alpha/beta hydrolase [Proteobacteria bacterium]|nr:alpha/beta hydrolase [Pseudomonadota bacterium]
MAGVTLVTVPGHGNAGPDHWQTLLERAEPGTVRVQQRSWTMPVRRQWVGGLERTLARLPGEVVLIGHSLGAMTIVEWGLRSTAAPRVAGAVLVAPPDLDQRLPGMPPRWIVGLCGWRGVPMRPLPFRSVLIASTDDPFCSAARAELFARAWGSVFADLGPCGHINTEAGFGPFPALDPVIAMFR